MSRAITRRGPSISTRAATSAVVAPVAFGLSSTRLWATGNEDDYDQGARMSHYWKEPGRSTRFRRSAPIIIATLTTIAVAIARVAPAWVDEWCYWVALAAAIVTGFIAICGAVRRQPFVHKSCVADILEHLGREVWTGSLDSLEGGLEQHRITLFQLRRRPRSKRLGDLFVRIWHRLRRNSTAKQRNWTHELVPRLRDPKSGPRPKRVFRIHDRRHERTEGIAGRVHHASLDVVIARDLPDISSSACASAEDYSEYARRTNDTVEMVKREKYQTRTIGGMIVYVGGERWGVLVFDSRDSGALSDDSFSRPETRRTIALLSAILGRTDGEKP